MLRRDEKELVRSFYDDVGWKEDESGFVDGQSFDDHSAHAEPYNARANQRVQELLPGGRLLLDAASGPVQFEDYRHFSDRYERRVCVDFSERALAAARARLGDHALCVIADVTRLPFRDGAVDDAISLHTIYHVPADEQADAVDELRRATARQVVIVYSSPSPLLVRALAFPLDLPRRVRKLLRGDIRRAARSTGRALYFRPHPLGWWRQWPHDLLVWRSLSPRITRGYRSRMFLAVVSRLEDWAPRLMGRAGQYPIILLRGSGPERRP